MSDADREALVQAALDARGRAYAPYSKFHVGAAVRGANGKTYIGANVENASFPLSVCAERNAIAAAVLDGVRVIEAVAIATPVSPPSSPCGGCRQVMAEFALDAEVLLVNDRGERAVTQLATLLPRAFHGRELPEIK